MRLVVHRTLRIGQLQTGDWNAVAPQFNFNPKSVYNPCRAPLSTTPAANVPQPMGHDILSKAYKNYVVIGAKMVCQIVGVKAVESFTASVSYNPFYICCRTSTSASGTTPHRVPVSDTVQRVLGEGSIRGQPVDMKLIGTPNLKTRDVYVGSTYAPRKVFGIPKKDSLLNTAELVYDSNTGDPIAEDPSRYVNFNLFALPCPQSTGNTEQDVLCKITLTFLVIWTNRDQQNLAYTPVQPGPIAPG